MTKCSHRLVDARNKVVTSGYLCIDCGAVFAAADHEGKKQNKLFVWYGSMPESNGKKNWAAILHNGDLTDGITIERSEYPDQVRYYADCVRYLIGDLETQPFILDYDADKCDTPDNDGADIPPVICNADTKRDPELRKRLNDHILKQVVRVCPESDVQCSKGCGEICVRAHPVVGKTTNGG